MNQAAPAPPATSDTERTARNLSALIIGSVLSKGVLFVWQIVLASWLGPFEYGVYGTIVGLLAIGTSVAGFGISLIAIREVAAHPQRIGAYATAMLSAQTVLAGLAYVGVVLSAAIAGYSSLIIAYTAIAGLSLLVDTGGNIAHDLLLAQERMVLTSAIDIGQILLRVGLSAGVLLADGGLFGLYIVAIITGLLRGVALWGVHWRSGLRLVWPVDRTLLVAMLGNASPLALSAFLSLSYQHADKLMTTALIGETQTGFIAPAFIINFGVTEVLSTAVLVAMYPLMARYYHSANPQAFGAVVEKLARFMLIAALPIALVLSIFSTEIVALIFRSGEYGPTAGILRILIWYTLLAMVGNVFSKALLIQNRQRLILLIRVGSLALNIALNLVLLSQYRDPRGAALASVVAEGLALALMMSAFSMSGFSWQRVLPSLGRVLLIGIGAGSIMVLLSSIAAPLAFVAGLSVYALAIVYGGVLQANDWDLVYRLLAAMPGGTLVRRVWQRQIVSDVL